MYVYIYIYKHKHKQALAYTRDDTISPRHLLWHCFIFQVEQLQIVALEPNGVDGDIKIIGFSFSLHWLCVHDQTDLFANKSGMTPTNKHESGMA